MIKKILLSIAFTGLLLGIGHLSPNQSSHESAATYILPMAQGHGSIGD